MSPYLNFELGSSEEARGRALIHIKSQDDNTHLARIYECNGTALKEAMYGEIIDGRIIELNVFDPFYIKTRPYEGSFGENEIIEYCSKECLDLIQERVGEIEILPESVMEQMIARYTTVYRENIYLRLVNQFAGEIFRRRKTNEAQDYYIAIFKTSYWMNLLIRAIREQDRIEQAFCRKNMQDLQKLIPMLDIEKIIACLEKGNWLEIARYIDALYITLKKHFPFGLNKELSLTANKESSNWLETDLQAIYQEYFLAIMREQYEKAGELQKVMEQEKGSGFLNGCSKPPL